MSLDQLPKNKALDFDTAEIQMQLANIVSEAERAEESGEKVPDHLIQEMGHAAKLLLETLPELPEDGIDQLTATSLANVYHFTEDNSIIEPVLEAVNKDPEYETQTKAPIASAIMRIAQTGMSIHESMQIEYGNNPVRDRSGPVVPDLPSEPLTSDYDWLFDKDAPRG